MKTGRIILSISTAFIALSLSACIGGYHNTGKKDAALPTDTCHTIKPAQRVQSMNYSRHGWRQQQQPAHEKALQKDYLKQGCA